MYSSDTRFLKGRENNTSAAAAQRSNLCILTSRDIQNPSDLPRKRVCSAVIRHDATYQHIDRLTKAQSHAGLNTELSIKLLQRTAGLDTAVERRRYFR